MNSFNEHHKIKLLRNKIVIVYFATFILQSIGLQGQANFDYYEKRVKRFEEKFSKGNVSTKKTDIEAALLLKDSLLLINRIDLLAEHFKTIGKMYQQIGQMNSAESAFLLAIKSGQKSMDSIWLGNTYSRVGSFYAIENRSVLALDFQLKALELLEKHDKTKKSIPEVYNDISRAYIQLGDLDIADKYLKKSLKLKTELRDTFRLGVISNLYADIYRLRGEFNKAEEFYLKDIPKRVSQKNYEGSIMSYQGLGDTYFEWNKPELAEKYYIKALHAADTIKRYRSIGLSLIKLGNLYLKTGRNDEAQRSFQRAIEECTQVDSRVYQESAYLALYELNKKNGSLTTALSYLEKYIEVEQTRTNEAFKSKSDDMQASFELRERENELSRLEAENKRNSQTQKILIMGIAILLILSGFLVFLYFTRNRILKSLYSEQENTRNLLKEKEELLNNIEETHHQLVHIEKMASIGVMTAGIAHELNNPVSSIHASVEALKMDYEDLKPVFSILSEINIHPSAEKLQLLQKELLHIDISHLSTEIKSLLTNIMNGSQRTSDIIQGMKTFSRDSGEVNQAYFIEDGLDAALTLLNHKMKDHIVVIKKYNFKNVVNCNVSKINQVFLNILDNAIHSMSTDGILEIETLLDKDVCKIKISDNGNGIEESIQQKIFEPFFTTKEIGYGTGLGLAISYAIIKGHNGDIKVQSSPNEGTSMIISLPLV